MSVRPRLPTAARAESFLTELDREYYLHFSGQKPDYEVEAIYDRHEGLFERVVVEELRAEAARLAGVAEAGEAPRRAAYLLEFAVGGCMGRACAGEEAALAEREARLQVEVGGERIPYRSAPVAQANEADPSAAARSSGRASSCSPSSSTRCTARRSSARTS